MPTTSEALDNLLARLRQLGAEFLVAEIQAAIAEGTVAEIEGGQKSRRRLEPVEAYGLAVRMILAALDPALMLATVQDTVHEFSPGSEVVWRPDFLEGVQAETGGDREISPPEIDRVRLLRVEEFAFAVVKALPGLGQDGE